MVIESPAFTPMKLEEERDEDSKVFTIRLNKAEMLQLEEAGRVLQQEKPGTIIKQLALIGLQDVLHDEKVRLILGIGFKNKDKNDRLGIATPQPVFMQK
jgi:hypothetical protein